MTEGPENIGVYGLAEAQGAPHFRAFTVLRLTLVSIKVTPTYTDQSKHPLPQMMLILLN